MAINIKCLLSAVESVSYHENWDCYWCKLLSKPLQMKFN